MKRNLNKVRITAYDVLLLGMLLLIYLFAYLLLNVPYADDVHRRHSPIMYTIADDEMV